MAENRFATPEEQETLSRFVGWGGLQNALDERKEDWAKEYKQIKKLLTDDEFRTAKASTMNAHYTSVEVIRAMYTGLEKLGFKGGRLLEPACGVGNFAGAMPPELAANSRWTMVELDSITGNIAKYLYPNASVRVQGFEEAKIPDNYMDAAISNVPFGNYGIADKSYPKTVTGSIHNYFFAKALDKVRPGGVVAFITSRYTMDSTDSKVRSYIMQRADLLGAIRLPDTAFQDNAGTSVVTDILILKKRAEGTKYAGEAFLETGFHHQDQNIWEQTNNYFAEHPEMVLGDAARGTMYRGSSLTYHPKDTKLSLGKQIERAFSEINGKMDYPAQRTPEQVRGEIKRDAAKGKQGSYQVKGGKLYKNDNGEAVEVKANPDAIKRIEGMTGVRDAARELLNAQLGDKSAAEIKIVRNRLNRLYDAFVKEYGYLNDRKNLKAFADDPDAPFLLALENYDKDTKTATKSAIFSKNTVTPNVTVTHTDTVGEALAVSMNRNGRIDTALIAKLTSSTPGEVTRSMLDSGLAFKNRDGELEPAELYLSGNVKAKLRDAEALAEGDPDYERNVEELKKIIPKDIPADEISVRPGTTWIPTNIYADFAAEMLGGRNHAYSPAVVVSYNALAGQYEIQVKDKWLKSSPENTSTWGTPEKSFVKILAATMNNKNVTVYNKTEDGKRFVNKQATAAAQEKQEKILSEFQKWLWQDEKRKVDLVRLYNDVFNNTVTPKYDGSTLTVDGANAEKPLREHQRNAVYRAVVSGRPILLAHRVGAGKTYEMAATAMKLRQLGIVKKPTFVVPKSLVSQWGREFQDFFPAAKTLVLRDTDFNAKNRKTFANRIATGDFDAVIMSYEQFKAVPMSAENQKAFYQEQIDALEMAILETAQQLGKRDPSIKQLEKSKKSLETKLKRLADMKKDENNIDFEELGIDSLFVDEAHNFKNLFYTTNMSNVSGLSGKDGSQKAFDLYMKTRYLQNMNGGRGIVFATATPVMNSMSEMYIMQKYLESDDLEARGLTSFDAWANQFGEVRTVLEMNPSGKGYRQKQSFSRFKNLAELQQMFRSFTDVVTDIPGLKIPSMRGGKRIVVESEPSDFQLRYIDGLAERADAIKKGNVDPSVDNMLKITSEGRKLSYTQRMIDPTLPYEDGCKIKKCAQNVFDEWKATENIKGTQLVFCDLSTPKGSAVVDNTDAEAQPVEEITAEDISIYDDMRNMLIAQGIPANEIAFIHDANTNDKKAQLFADMNSGKVRVLIGSTGKMGVGMNAQERMVAIHHLDAPWRPGDIEQRDGRGLRQGNINDEVAVYVYVTKSTFDSRMWDNLQRKASFIHQIMAGDLTARESEGDGDFALSAAEIKAISSGNPLIMEQFEVAAELQKLESLERAHNKEVSDARLRIIKTKQQIAVDEGNLANLRNDAKRAQDTSGDKFSVKVNSQTFTDRKAAGEALIEQGKRLLNMNREGETPTLVGTFAGFDLYVTDGAEMLLRGDGQYRAQINMQSPTGTVQSLEAAVRRIDTLLSTTETRLKEQKSAVAKLEKVASAPFERAEELSKVRKRNAEIMAELNPVEDTAGYGEDADEADDVEEMRGSSNEDMWRGKPKRSGTQTGAKGVGEILEQIRHDFDVNITAGHVRGAKRLGLYNRSNRGIRVKHSNDLPIATHELGHHLDNVYGLRDGMTAEIANELVNGLTDEQRDTYKKKSQQITEGIAEYFRKYLQDRDTAAVDFPEFTAYFKQHIRGNDLAQIDKLADEINAYYVSIAKSAAEFIRDRSEKAPDARTWREKLKDTNDEWYQRYADSNHAIKMMTDELGDDTAYKLATNAAYRDAVAASNILYDLRDINGKYVSGGLKAALSGVNLKNKSAYKAFNEYLVVRHAPERLAEGMTVFNDPIRNKTEWMNNRQAELEAQYPEFEAAADRLYDFIGDLYQTWGVNTGLISQDMLDQWRERWAYYVPFNRVVPKGRRGRGTKRSFANQDSTVRRAHGSTKEIINPVDNLIDNLVRLVNAGVLNNVMQEITKVAEQGGADAAWMERVPVPLRKIFFDAAGYKDTIADALIDSNMSAEDKAIALDTLGGIDTMLEQFGKGKARGDVVTVMKNGNQEFWKVNDPLLLQSLSNLTPTQLPKVLEAYGNITRFMTAAITGNDVIWGLFSNFPRDLQTLMYYTGERNKLKLLATMGESYVNKFKLASGIGTVDPVYMEYVAMGGGGAMSAYTSDRNLADNSIRRLSGDKTLYINPLEWLAFISDTIEGGPRFATYKACRARGFTPQAAIYAAHDITVNFRRAGTESRQINKFIPYFNAGVQGLDKYARWLGAEDVPLNERKSAAKRRLFVYLATSAVLGALMYAINNRDDEAKKDYQLLSNYTKNSYYNFPLGDGRYFAIPKARELSVPTSLFETLAERYFGGNEHAFDEFWSYSTDNFLPPVVGDIASMPEAGIEKGGYGAISSFGALGVVGSLAANRDYLGKPIVSAGMQYYEPRDQYNERTSKLAKALGEGLNYSPQKIDYALQQTLGGFWKYQKALFPVGSENVDLTLGVQNRYVKDNQYSTDLVNRMYDRAAASDAAKKSDPMNNRKAVAAAMDSRIKDFYSNYYSVAKNNTELQRGTRQEVLNILLEYEKESEHGYQADDPASANNYIHTPTHAAICEISVREGDTALLPSTMNVKIKDGNGVEHLLSDVEYVEYQTDYLRRYYEYIEDTLPKAKSEKQEAAIIRAAKNYAKDGAQDRVLKRIGAPAGDAVSKYGKVSTSNVILFKSLLDLADDDGSLKQDEVIAAIDRLSLSRTESSTLFHTKYTSDKNNPYK